MEFERDPDKNEQNIGKHGIDFVRAKEVFGGLYSNGVPIGGGSGGGLP